MAAVLQAPNQLCYLLCLFALFLTCFVHNVDATASYDQKELLDIRTVITHLKLEEDLFFKESDEKDIMLLPDKDQIHVIHMKKRRRYWERRSGCLVRIHWLVGSPPLPSILLV
jgi:hypothetical protein